VGRKRRIVAAALVAVWLIFGARPVLAGLDEGVKAYREGDFAKALEEFLPLAAAGDVAVQNQVAAMYYTGQGAPQDFAKAAEWFRKAAGAGSADGQYCLGKLYYYGQGVPQNFEDAAKLLTEAGLAGKGGAQYLLATLYLYGKGVSKNVVKAYFWSILAVDAPDLPAEDKPAALSLRDQIQSGLAQRQINSIQAMARDWSPRKKKAN
jgi:TPR repeat protein